MQEGEEACGADPRRVPPKGGEETSADGCGPPKSPGRGIRATAERLRLQSRKEGTRSPARLTRFPERL